MKGLWLLTGALLLTGPKARASIDLTCTELVARLSPVDSYRGDKVPTKAQKNLALKALRDLPADTNTSFSEIRNGFQSDFAAAYFKNYSKLRNCHKTRSYLIQMLIKYAAQPKISRKEKAGAIEVIRTELSRPTFPLLSTMSLKIDDLERALDKKILANPKAAELMAELTKERENEDQKLTDLQNELYPESVLREDLDETTVEHVKERFNDLANKGMVERLKEVLLAEISAVERLEARYLKILSESR